jgi:heterodisulfide reductase subunit A
LKQEEKSDVRVGVFVCDCGSNIAGYLQMKELVEYAKTLPNVVFVQENPTPARGWNKRDKDAIRET